MANLCCHPFFMHNFLHRFQQDLSEFILPEKFTNPFSYLPHPLVLLAKEQVAKYLATKTEFKRVLDAGKMLGVMVVRDSNGELGFLAGYSGRTITEDNDDYFAPVLFDPNASEYYINEDKEIGKLSEIIAYKEDSQEFVEL